MRKIITVFSCLIVIFALFLLGREVFYPTWEGTTQDMNWKAVYRKSMFDPHHKWEGKLYWKGPNDAYLTFLQFKINDQLDSGMENGQSAREPIQKVYDFVVLGEKPNKDDQLELIVGWEINGENHIETIRLK